LVGVGIGVLVGAGDGAGVLVGVVVGVVVGGTAVLVGVAVEVLVGVGVLVAVGVDVAFGVAVGVGTLCRVAECARATGSAPKRAIMRTSSVAFRTKLRDRRNCLSYLLADAGVSVGIRVEVDVEEGVVVGTMAVVGVAPTIGTP
jgi:hypothetical protein